MAPRLTRVPSLAVEALRLLVVVFGAAVGYLLAQRTNTLEGTSLGALDSTAVGVVVGAGVGFVVGGVLARWVLRAIDRGERSMEGLSAEQLVAGSLGALVGVLFAALFTWPLFLLVPPLLAVSVFAFLLLVAGIFGFRVGRRRRDAVLAGLGGRAGLASRTPSTASLPRVLDTSVAIDGRILEVVRAGFLHGRVLVCAPVLGELQMLSDSSDDLRRARGRRGLATLEALREERDVDVEVIGDEAPGVQEVDAKLVRTCLDRHASLLTFDTNLARVAALAGVQVQNMHQLAVALRPPVVVGDEVAVQLARAGKEAGQAVAYLDDGTMVVVEHGRERLGLEVAVTVTSVLTTANGRMVFARPSDLGDSVLPRGGTAVPPGRHDPTEAMRAPGASSARDPKPAAPRESA
jgi:uncharacterized protein YacL